MAYTTDHSRPLERLRDPPSHGTSRHPRFRDLVQWREFPRPPTWERAGGRDRHAEVAASTRFELQGVLVAPGRQSTERVSADELVVLPKGRYPNELERLVPMPIT